MKFRKYTKTLCGLLTLALLCSILTPAGTTQAATKVVKNDSQIIPLEDGTITVVEIEVPEISTYSVRTTSGFKAAKNLNSDGTINWRFVLNASFRFDLIAATCTSCSTDYSIANSEWKISNVSCSKSGDSAYASFTAKRYILGVCVKTRNESLKFTCSPKGDLS